MVPAADPAGAGHGHLEPRHHAAADLLRDEEREDRRLRSEPVASSSSGWVHFRASNEGYPKVREDFTITEKAPTRAFSWLKAKVLVLSHLRHY